LAAGKVRVVEPLALDELELAGQVTDDSEEVQPSSTFVAVGVGVVVGASERYSAAKHAVLTLGRNRFT
jgi:hypothetical protein